MSESDQELFGMENDKGSRMDYLQKLILAGSAFRLPDEPSKVDSEKYEAWLSGLRSANQDEDITRVEKLKFLWSRDCESQYPEQGVPQSLEQLQYLLNIGRVSRLDIEYTSHGNVDGHPSATAWKKFLALKHFVVIETTPTGGDKISPPELNLRVIGDCIVDFLSDKMYDDLENEVDGSKLI